jgi:hypothetical protein
MSQLRSQQTLTWSEIFSYGTLSRIKNKIHNCTDDNKTGKSGERGNPVSGVNLKESWSLYMWQWLNYIIIRDSYLENMLIQVEKKNYLH